MRKVSIEHKRRVRHLVYVRFKTRHPNAYKEYRDNNKEHRAAKERERYAKNKETIRNQQREYYDKTKEKKCISSRKYHWQNREKRNKQAAERRHRRLGVDPLYRFLEQCRRRINLIIRHAGKAKVARISNLCGCEGVFLRAWLEIQFKPGMTWENYGRHGWHVDHIRPCNSFDLSDQTELRKCFHFTNLQPLWAAEKGKSHESPCPERSLRAWWYRQRRG